jgi:23S rRNA pseudouridine1911/1915/1917 synthase
MDKFSEKVTAIAEEEQGSAAVREQHFSAPLDAPRMDKCLQLLMPDKSRSFCKKLLGNGLVTVDGRVVDAAYKPRAGSCILCRMPEISEAQEVKSEKIPLDIIYEDSCMLVVNKPKGMVTHPAAGNYEHTLVNALLGYGCPLSDCNGDPLRPGIVHRLDKDTTGLLVVAKTNAAHENLARQIREKEAHRIYTALCFGNVRSDTGIIDQPIGRHPVDRKKMAIVQGGRPAVTEYTVLARYGSYTLMQARLQTGRTHQIRVHFAHQGFAVVGDPLYTRQKSPFTTQGQVLHAGRLELRHPQSGRWMVFEAPLPVYFEEILQKLEARRIE